MRSAERSDEREWQQGRGSSVAGGAGARIGEEGRGARAHVSTLTSLASSCERRRTGKVGLGVADHVRDAWRSVARAVVERERCRRQAEGPNVDGRRSDGGSHASTPSAADSRGRAFTQQVAVPSTLTSSRPLSLDRCTVMFAARVSRWISGGRPGCGLSPSTPVTSGGYARRAG